MKQFKVKKKRKDKKRKNKEIYKEKETRRHRGKINSTERQSACLEFKTAKGEEENKRTTSRQRRKQGDRLKKYQFQDSRVA